ncbi:MAG: histidine kinase, partial [Phycisphaeraceae bacterium]
LGTYFFLSPRWSFGYGNQAFFLVKLLIFLVTGVLISALSAARLKAMRELEATVRRLRWMGSELTFAEDRQRRAIARALHDHLQQLLVAARLKIGRLKRDDQPEPARAVATDVDALLNEAITYTRTLTVELSPSVLYSDGLVAALHALVSQVLQRYNLNVTVQADAEADDADEATRVVLYQAVRELLFNVAKHAKTDRANVRLWRENGMISIVVEDGGVGIKPNYKPGLGLLSIEERLHAIGGCMQIAPGKAGGSRFVLLGPAQILSNRPTAKPLPECDGESDEVTAAAPAPASASTSGDAKDAQQARPT